MRILRFSFRKITIGKCGKAQNRIVECNSPCYNSISIKFKLHKNSTDAVLFVLGAKEYKAP